MLFQFHYGSVKRVGRQRKMLILVNFNSTMVRLKEVNHASICVEIYGFQFHYGSVKSVKEMGNNIARSIFQFHYGSVKSCKKEMDKDVVD